MRSLIQKKSHPQQRSVAHAIGKSGSSSNNIIQLNKEDESSLPSPSSSRAGLDLVNNAVGLASDVKKKKSKTEIGGRVIKIAGSASKVAGKSLLTTKESQQIAGDIGVNLKTTGGDISELGRVLKDNNASTTKKGIAATRAMVSVSGTTSEVLRNFGYVGEVPASIATLISDTIKTFTYTHDFYEIASKMWTSYQRGTLVAGLWSEGTKFIQTIGSASLSLLRALAMWEKIKETDLASNYTKLMPLGKSLTNLGAALQKGKEAYENYQGYAKLARLASTPIYRGTRAGRKILLIAHAKWDQFVKSLIDSFVGVGESVYWAGKYFPMIKVASTLTGLGSKALKTASTAFSYFNVRQVARDWIPLGGLGIVDKNKTSDRLTTKRANLITFLRNAHANERPGHRLIIEQAGVDHRRINDDNYMGKVAEKLV